MRKVIALSMLLSCASVQAGLYDDPAFGGGGYVDVELGGSQYLYDPPELVVLPDRRIVAATMLSTAVPHVPALKVVRLLPDGGRDPAFGVDGVATVPLAPLFVDWSYVTALVPLADGRLYVLGYTVRIEHPSGGSGPVHDQRTYLVRLRSDGSIDPNFNAGSPWSGDDLMSHASVLPQDDGLLIVGPGFSCCTLGSGLQARRFHLDGSPDPAFGTGGLLSVPASGSETVGVMPVAGGGFQVLHHKPWAHGQPARNFWRRYRVDGSIEVTYGSGGEQQIPLTESFGMTQLHALGDGTQLGVRGTCPMRRFDAEGRVLAVYRDCTSTGSTNFRVRRYGEKWLFSGEERFGGVPPPSDGTYLHVTDASGRVDAAFAAPQGLRWRPPDAPNASYAVAADGDAHVVIARGTDSGIRVRRYRDLRGSDPLAEPVPALLPAATVLLCLCLLLIAGRRLRPAWSGSYRKRACRPPAAGRGTSATASGL